MLNVLDDVLCLGLPGRQRSSCRGTNLDQATPQQVSHAWRSRPTAASDPHPNPNTQARVIETLLGLDPRNPKVPKANVFVILARLSPPMRALSLARASRRGLPARLGRRQLRLLGPRGQRPLSGCIEADQLAAAAFRSPPEVAPPHRRCEQHGANCREQ